jgi:hypothetical protein
MAMRDGPELVAVRSGGLPLEEPLKCYNVEYNQRNDFKD